MSADHLPEDLRRWPRDPFQILGVARGCDPLAVRKAYAQLIRHFKPEQYPEHFRLIREAYDTVKRQAQFLGSLNTDAAADVRSLTPDAAAPGHSHPAVQADSLQVLWDMACTGQEEEAYRRFREMYEINPHGGELPARLYALLLANPELDCRRVPCYWLVRGAAAEGPWGPCRQLYRREIDDHPEEALSDRFLSLMDNVAPPRNVLELLVWRWEALARLDRTMLIAEDLRRVAFRLERTDEEGWVRVQLKAADYLAWHPDNQFDELSAEIESHVHLHATLGEDLSRLDFLRDLSESWHRLLGGPLATVPLVKVLPWTWTSPYENRHRILVQCRAAAENPKAALNQLDAIQKQNPLVSAHLGQTLAWLWYAPADPREPSDLLPAINEHLGGLSQPVCEADYALYRQQLLRLCVAEVIAPETVANLLDPKRVTFVLQRIHDDWPLRTVCLAHRLIWA